MRDESPVASNWRAQGTLRDYLVANSIVAICRHRHARADAHAALRRRDARRHRDRQSLDPTALVERARRRFRRWKGRIWCGMSRPTRRSTGREEDPGEFGIAPEHAAEARLKIAAYDFGMKWNILRRLSAHGCDVRVYPGVDAGVRAAGDQPRRRVPEQRPRRSGAARPTPSTTRRRSSTSGVPVFGICLGPPDPRSGDGRQTRSS